MAFSCDWHTSRFPQCLRAWVEQEDSTAFDEIASWLRLHAPKLLGNRGPENQRDAIVAKAVVKALVDLQSCWETFGEASDARKHLEKWLDRWPQTAWSPCWHVQDFPRLLREWVKAGSSEALEEMTEWLEDHALEQLGTRGPASDRPDIAMMAVLKARDDLKHCWEWCQNNSKEPNAKLHLNKWLSGLARTANARAGKWRQRYVCIDAGATDEEGAPAPIEVPVDVDYHRAMEIPEVRQAVWAYLRDHLDHTTAELFRLKYVEELDVKDAAGMLCMTRSAAARRVHDAENHPLLLACLANAAGEEAVRDTIWEAVRTHLDNAKELFRLLAVEQQSFDIAVECVDGRLTTEEAQTLLDQTLAGSFLRQAIRVALGMTRREEGDDDDDDLDD